MERRTHLKQYRSLRSSLLSKLRRSLDRLAVSGYDDLSGRIQIRRRDDLALSGSLADRLNRRQIQAEQRRHYADANRNRLLHVLPPPPDQSYRFRQRQGASSDKRRILAQTVACHKIRPNSFLCQHSKQSSGNRENCRLRILGPFQIFVETVKA